MIRYTIDMVDEVWREKIRMIRHATTPLVERATYKTGSISDAAMYYLWTLCKRISPTHIVEIGTFIGNSTAVLANYGLNVYTCDKDNDCLNGTDIIHPFPKTTSTQMLWELVQKGVKADLFFFDGRIQPPDLALILRLSHPMTAYVFDDYERVEKGVVNVRLLFPYLLHHTLILPPERVADYESRTSIACLMPKEWV